MAQVSKHPVSPKIEKKVYKVFVDSVKNTKSSNEAYVFLEDLLTRTEKIMLSKRLAIAILLLRGDYTHRGISRTLKVGHSTIGKVDEVLHLNKGGYKAVVLRILKKKALKQVLGELFEAITPFPPKGANWGVWKKQRQEAERKRKNPF